MNASETRIDSPRMFGSNLFDADVELKATARAFGNPSGQAAQAPFTADARNKLGDMPLPVHSGGRAASSACERSASDLCYDLADRRIVYRPARRYMPKLEGFTAESVSLRRDAIRFRYSFP